MTETQKLSSSIKIEKSECYDKKRKRKKGKKEKRKKIQRQKDRQKAIKT
jgi:hypothetical protein